MWNFVAISGISLLAIAVTSMLTYEILRKVWHVLPRVHCRPRVRVLLIVGPIFLAHMLSIWIYAGLYFLLEYQAGFGQLSGHISPVSLSLDSFIERLYFSASTYASLGLGDIVPGHNLRMLSAAEVLNGLVMIGWTISFTYLAMEKFWAMPHHPYSQPPQE